MMSAPCPVCAAGRRVRVCAHCYRPCKHAGNSTNASAPARPAHHGVVVDEHVPAVGHEPLHRPQVAVHGAARVGRRDVEVAAAGLGHVWQRHWRRRHRLADLGAAVLRVHRARAQLLQRALVRAVATDLRTQQQQQVQFSRACASRTSIGAASASGAARVHADDVRVMKLLWRPGI